MAKDVFDLFDKRKQELANDNTLIRKKNVDDIDAIRSIFTDKQSKYKKCIQTMRIKTTRFNLLNDNEPSGLKELDPYSIYLIGIIASDDSNDHGIAIYNDWIFDANVPHALPYCKDGLDYTTCNDCLLYTSPSPRDRG